MASTPYSDLKLPTFQTDPNYSASQDTLSKLGTDILAGNLPDYYKPIGQYNSPQFQSMVGNIAGQIGQSSMETAAAGGTARSGTATTATNDALSKILPSLNYQDYLNTTQNRIGLLNTGIGVESGVRSSGQEQQSQNNNFNQTIFEDQIQQQGLIDQYKKQAAAAQGQEIGNIASLAFGSNVGGEIGGAFGANQPTGNSAANANSNGALSNFFNMLGSMNSGSAPGANTGNGVVDPNFGAINSFGSLNSAGSFGGSGMGSELDLAALLA